MRILRREEYEGTPTSPPPVIMQFLRPLPAVIMQLLRRPRAWLDSIRPLVRRHPAELPQGRKAARVGRLWRVCERSFLARADLSLPGNRVRPCP